MKTQKELNDLKMEYKALSAKLQELTEEELCIVTGGSCPEEHNIMQTCEFKGNQSNTFGGGIYKK